MTNSVVPIPNEAAAKARIGQENMSSIPGGILEGDFRRAGCRRGNRTSGIRNVETAHRLRSHANGMLRCSNAASDEIRWGDCAPGNARRTGRNPQPLHRRPGPEPGPIGRGLPLCPWSKGLLLPPTPVAMVSRPGRRTFLTRATSSARSFAFSTARSTPRSAGTPAGRAEVRIRSRDRRRSDRCRRCRAPSAADVRRGPG